MTEPTPTPVPAPTPAERAKAVGDSIAARFDLSDKRNLIGLGVLAFCGGIIVGARLMRGAATQTTKSVRQVRSIADERGQATPGPVAGAHVHPADQPCAGCREKSIRQGREIQAQHEAAIRRMTTQPEPTEADVDQAERDATARRQLDGIDGLKTFSAYAEATLDEGLVTGGPEPVPGE